MSEEKSDVIIGLECHVQLDTESKLFCGCPTTANEPNSACCEVCLGFPGSKPVLNKKVLDYALKVSMALNCEINKEFFFSRKTYFYPDMSKNFQITQYEIPVGKNGYLTLSSGKKIKIERVHIEEDPAALVHESGMMMSKQTLVDYNRSGVPLVEIVTAPDMRSPQEARDFLDQLTTVLQYLGVFDEKDGTLKIDSNLSIKGSERVEVKNVTGKRGVEKAMAFEAVRQKGVIAKGETIPRETRAFNEQTLTTRALRSKETEADYGYIFEPDLPAFELGEKYLDSIKKSLPELHDAKAKRFVQQYSLDEYTAGVLSRNSALGSIFEEAVKSVDVGLAAKFLTRELLGILNYNNLSFEATEIKVEELVSLMQMLEKGDVSEKNAKQALIKYVLEKVSPSKFIEEQGLKKDLDETDLQKAIETVLDENRPAVADFKKGGEKALHFLVGKVMQLTKGKADARDIQKKLKEKIEAK
jgi:aspartyl-tRNA(Asn)/glutamyl-tRNA(Gln) amidotransferase subunit B